MKQIAVTLLSLLLVLSLLSCGGTPADDGKGTEDASPVVGSMSDETEGDAPASTDDTDAPDAGSPDTTDSVSASAEGYLCILENGASICLGAGAETVIPTLGDYTDFMEAPSCVHEGSDKVYTYEGAYTVTTSPDASGKEYVASVSLISDAVGLEAGEILLMIGSPEADLKAAFGEPLEDSFGVQKYAVEGGLVTVTVDDGTVTALAITLP